MRESTIEVTFLPIWFATPVAQKVTFDPRQPVHVTHPADAKRVVMKLAADLSTRDNIRRCCLEDQTPHEAR